MGPCKRKARVAWNKGRLNAAIGWSKLLQCLLFAIRYETSIGKQLFWKA